MKRGTVLERGLAYAGVILWALWAFQALMAPRSRLIAVLCAMGVVVGVQEISRWRSWEQYSSPARRRGKDVYPRWAWFAVGAVPATTAVAIALVIWIGPTGDYGWEWTVATWTAWVVAGFATERSLVKRAMQRESMRAVPPAPPAPQKGITASGMDARTGYPPHLPSRPTASRKLDAVFIEPWSAGRTVLAGIAVALGVIVILGSFRPPGLSPGAPYRSPGFVYLLGLFAVAGGVGALIRRKPPLLSAAIGAALIGLLALLVVGVQLVTKENEDVTSAVDAMIQTGEYEESCATLTARPSERDARREVFIAEVGPDAYPPPDLVFDELLNRCLYGPDAAGVP